MKGGPSKRRSLDQIFSFVLLVFAVFVSSCTGVGVGVPLSRNCPSFEFKTTSFRRMRRSGQKVGRVFFAQLSHRIVGDLKVSQSASNYFPCAQPQLKARLSTLTLPASRQVESEMSNDASFTPYERWVRRLYQTNLFNPVKLGLQNIQQLHSALGSPIDRVSRMY